MSNGEPTDEVHGGVPEEEFKEALSFHATGVTVVAVRDDESLYSTTVTSFIPVSVDPPTVLVSVGGSAQALPFLVLGRAFGVSVLRADQGRLASVYADSFPVGPSPFPAEGLPLIPEALAGLGCRVDSLVETPGGRLVLARVEETRSGQAGGPLIYYRRGYRTLEEG